MLNEMSDGFDLVIIYCNIDVEQTDPGFLSSGILHS